VKVYVLETGCYENRAVAGIFDNPERAMAQAKGEWMRETYFKDDGTPVVSWSNDLDWDSAASVSEYDVTDTGSERAHDSTRVQIYRPLDGHWAYLPESEGVIQLGRDATAVMRVHEARGQWQEPGPTEIDRRIDAARGAADKLSEAMG